MNRLFLTIKSIISPLFLKGSVIPSASPNVGALKLKRIGIRCYWFMVKLNFTELVLLCFICCVLFVAIFMLHSISYGWLLIVIRLKLFSFQLKNRWLRRRVRHWLLHFLWRLVIWLALPYLYLFLVCLHGNLYHVDHSKNWLTLYLIKCE